MLQIAACDASPPISALEQSAQGVPRNMKEHVLVVEDDEFVVSLLGAYLEAEGFRVSLATTGREMMAVLDHEPVDLILLDLGLPDEDGLVLMRQVRARSGVPICVLTARRVHDDRIAALELGADDYMTKPCDPHELVLRVRNLLGRSGPNAGTAADVRRNDVLRFDGWALDVGARALLAPDGHDVPLTPSEFNLLAALARAPNRALSRDHLLDALTRDDEASSDRAVDVLVSRLRKKMESDPQEPRLILTVRGIGYKLVVGSR